MKHPHGVGLGHRFGFPCSSLADPLADLDQRDRPRQRLGGCARHVRETAQHVHPRGPGGAECVQIHLPRARPSAGQAGLAVHRVGRRLKEKLRRFDLPRVEGPIAGLLLSLGESLVASVFHGDRQLVLDRLAGLFHGRGRGVVVALEQFLGGRAGGQSCSRLPSGDPFPGLGLAARHDSFENVRTGGIGPELGAGHPRHPGSIGGVDDDLGPHRLAARPVGHHHARRLAGAVREHVRDETAI